MPIFAFAERRIRTRLPTDGLLVTLRRKGRLSRLEGLAVDFSRYGLGLILDQPLPKDCTVYLALTGAGQRLENVIGIVHNCIATDEGYRCGIAFRTTSDLQEDQQRVENTLVAIENFFGAPLGDQG